MDNTVCGWCSVSQITHFRRCIFSKNIYIYHHLKLEIALAIPASNDEKYNWNNSAGQGLMLDQRHRRWALAQRLLFTGISHVCCREQPKGSSCSYWYWFCRAVDLTLYSLIYFMYNVHFFSVSGGLREYDSTHDFTHTRCLINQCTPPWVG